MDNLNIYNKIFMDILSLDESRLEKNPQMKDIELWDSIGHINLIAELEDRFHIELTMEEMSEIVSYEKGREILQRHGIEL